jgi:hypothetical protein
VDAACQNDRFSCRAAEWEITPLQQYSRCERTQHENPIHRLGSLPPLAAFAHRKNWIAAPSVRFHHVAQLDLRAQRMAALRPSCRNLHGAEI